MSKFLTVLVVCAVFYLTTVFGVTTISGSRMEVERERTQQVVVRETQETERTRIREDAATERLRIQQSGEITRLAMTQSSNAMATIVVVSIVTAGAVGLVVVNRT